MIILPRADFLKVMDGSANLPYIMEISGFAKSKADVNINEVMKRIDLFDIINFMTESGDNDVVEFIRDTWITPVSTETGGGYVSWEGFDCYLPYDEQRDYLIKQFIKTRSREGLKVGGRKLESDRTSSLINQIDDLKN